MAAEEAEERDALDSTAPGSILFSDLCFLHACSFAYMLTYMMKMIEVIHCNFACIPTTLIVEEAADHGDQMETVRINDSSNSDRST